MFSWADLATPDVASSKKFYTELLEVDSTDVVAGPDAFYTILNKNGRSTCAIYQMDEEMRQMMRGQAAWHSYSRWRARTTPPSSLKRLAASSWWSPSTSSKRAGRP